MKFTRSDLEHFENPQKKIKNGEVLLLNNIGNGIQATNYHAINTLNDNNWYFYILLNIKNDDTVSLCQLIPFENNESWPFSPIIINIINEKKLLIEQQFQPNLDAITSYHTIFNLSYYDAANNTSLKRKQANIKTFYGLAKNEPRINNEILQVLNDTDNKFPTIAKKTTELKKRIATKNFLKKRWTKQKTIFFKPYSLTTILPTDNQQTGWSAQEFTNLNKDIQNESDKSKIIIFHIVSCLKPFLDNIIINQKNIKTEQQKRNDIVIINARKKLIAIKIKLKNIRQLITTEAIQSLQNEIIILNNMLVTTKTQNQIDNKSIKFSKKLITAINKYESPNKKIKTATKFYFSK